MKREGPIKVSFLFQYIVSIVKGGEGMSYFGTYLLIGLMFAAIMLVVAMVTKQLGCARIGHNLSAIAPVRYVTYVAFWPIWVMLLVFEEIVA